MDPRPVFGTGFDQRAISALPLATHRPALARCWTREECARRRGRPLAYGKAMDRKPKPKRIAPVSYRPPERLREEFHTRVRNSGLPVNAFITAAVFGQAAPKSRRAPPLDQQTATALLAQAARMTDQLRVMAGSTDDPGHAALIAGCRDELVEIRNILLALYGRQP